MMEFTREWFLDKDNQVTTIQDVNRFNLDKEKEKIIDIGEHFLVDLIPIDNNNDVEIWEVENTLKKHKGWPGRCSTA